MIYTKHKINRIITSISKTIWINRVLDFRCPRGGEFADNFLPHCGAFSHVFYPRPGALTMYFKNLSKAREGGWARLDLTHALTTKHDRFHLSTKCHTNCENDCEPHNKQFIEYSVCSLAALSRSVLKTSVRYLTVQT